MDTLISDDMTRYGLRRVHVIGSPAVDAAAWLERVPAEVPADAVQVVKYADESVGMGHLWLMWPAREGVKLADGRPVVMWWVAKSETLRQAAEAAALFFWALYGRAPRTAWVKKLPAEAAAQLVLDGDVVELREHAALPKRFLVLE